MIFAQLIASCLHLRPLCRLFRPWQHLRGEEVRPHFDFYLHSNHKTGNSERWFKFWSLTRCSVSKVTGILLKSWTTLQEYHRPSRLYQFTFLGLCKQKKAEKSKKVWKPQVEWSTSLSRRTPAISGLYVISHIFAFLVCESLKWEKDVS